MAKRLQYQVIARALKLVSDEQTWTRGSFARNAQGRPCPIRSSEAVRFCAVGALSRAAYDLLGESAHVSLIDEAESFVLAANGVEHLDLPAINDRGGREAIVSLFKRALVDA